MSDTKKTQFVQLSEAGEPVASTEVIAKGVQVQHKNIISLVKRHRPLLQRFGPIAFQTRMGLPLPQGGFGRQTEYALLNEPQAALLLTLTRNTDATMNFKANLVHEFFVMRDSLRSRDLTLWSQMQALIAKEVDSQVRASFGSKLLHDRKKEKPKLDTERFLLEAQIQPSLLN